MDWYPVLDELLAKRLALVGVLDRLLVADAREAQALDDDADALVFPGAEDVCDDGVDNDCSGAADDGCEEEEVEDEKCGCGTAPGNNRS